MTITMIKTMTKTTATTTTMKIAVAMKMTMAMNMTDNDNDGSFINCPLRHFYSVIDGNDVSIDDNYYYRVVIYPNGIVAWSPFFTWITSCDIDALYFPFDVQTCRVEFMNWIYRVDRVNFTVPSNNSIDTTLCKKSTDWIIKSHSTGSFVSSNTYPFIYFELVLERVPVYFIFYIILPTVCLSLLSTFVFLLPADSGEKMGLSVTTLMSYSVIFLMINDVIPKNSRPPVMCK